MYKDQRTPKKETEKEKKRRFKILDENPILVGRAKLGDENAVKHLDALIHDKPVDPKWLEEIKADEEKPLPVQELKMSNVPHVETRVTVVGDCIKTVLKDINGYILSVDLFKVKSVSRVSFNVAQCELIIVLPETMGSIGEVEKPLFGPGGTKTGGVRKELEGNTGPFKITIRTEPVIRQFLTVWNGVMDNTEFEGFEAYLAHQEKMKIAMEEAKQRDIEAKAKGETSPDEENKTEGSGIILDSFGELIQ